MQLFTTEPDENPDNVYEIFRTVRCASTFILIAYDRRFLFYSLHASCTPCSFVIFFFYKFPKTSGASVRLLAFRFRLPRVQRCTRLRENFKPIRISRLNGRHVARTPNINTRQWNAVVLTWLPMFGKPNWYSSVRMYTCTFATIVALSTSKITSVCETKLITTNLFGSPGTRSRYVHTNRWINNKKTISYRELTTMDGAKICF